MVDRRTDGRTEHDNECRLYGEETTGERCAECRQDYVMCEDTT